MTKEDDDKDINFKKSYVSKGYQGGGRVPMYREEFCNQLIDHMRQGGSFTTFTTIAKVNRDTLYKWLDKYPEFKEAKKIAEDEALKFFEKILAAKISGVDIPGFDPRKSDTACLIFALKTRFHKHYGEKAREEQSEPFEMLSDAMKKVKLLDAGKDDVIDAVVVKPKKPKKK